MNHLEQETNKVIEAIKALVALCDTDEKMDFVSSLINPAMDELMEQIYK